MRSENNDPAHGREAAKKRSRSNKARSNERKAWDAAHSPEEMEKERTRFKVEILPAIADFSIREIANATGFCLRYASLIRSGYIPHPVHYPRLEQLIRPQIE